MKNDDLNLLDVLIVLAESWRVLVVGPLAVAFFVAVTSLLLPTVYLSSALVKLEGTEIYKIYNPAVLNSIGTEYGYLKRANDVPAKAREMVKSDITFRQTPEAGVYRLDVKGSTAENAYNLATTTLSKLRRELAPDEDEIAEIVQRITIIDELIASGVLFIESPDIISNSRGVQSLKLLSIQLKKNIRDDRSDIVVLAPSLPGRYIAPNRRFIIIAAWLCSVALFSAGVLLRSAWLAGSQNPAYAQRLSRIKEIFTEEKSV